MDERDRQRIATLFQQYDKIRAVTDNPELTPTERAKAWVERKAIMVELDAFAPVITEPLS